MNILNIADFGAGDAINGVRSVVKVLQTETSHLGHNSVIGLVQPHNDVNHHDIFHISTGNSFQSLVDSINPDIVIFHGLYKLPYLKFANILRRKQIPYLIEFHGGATKDNANKNKFIKICANYCGFNKFVKMAKALIYLNEPERLASIFAKINDKSFIIPNGVYTNALSVSKRKQPGDSVELSFLGRIDIHHKGLDLLIDALKILNASKNSPKFHVSIYGKLKANDKELDKLLEGIPKSICEFKGPVTGRAKEKALQECNIFLHTSRYEGFPVAVLEALSYGCPCIVTPQTNVADIIEENKCGWITAPNSKNIAETIARAINDYRRNASCYEQACITLANRYEWSEIAKTAIEVYQKNL